MYPIVSPPGSKEEFHICDHTDYLGLHHQTKQRQEHGEGSYRGREDDVSEKEIAKWRGVGRKRGGK